MEFAFFTIPIPVHRASSSRIRILIHLQMGVRRCYDDAVALRGFPTFAFVVLFYDLLLIKLHKPSFCSTFFFCFRFDEVEGFLQMT